jgi:hypothetical protein
MHGYQMFLSAHDFVNETQTSSVQMMFQPSKNHRWTGIPDDAPVPKPVKSAADKLSPERAISVAPPSHPPPAVPKTVDARIMPAVVNLFLMFVSFVVFMAFPPPSNHERLLPCNLLRAIPMPR